MVIRWERLVEVATELGPDPELGDLDDDQLEADLRAHASRAAALTAELIVLIAELVVRGVWAGSGAKTPGQWLSWKVGMASSTARDHVRVGLALRGLPQVRARFLDGSISYSKVRAITRVTDADSEEMMLNFADSCPAAELERIVARARIAARAHGIEAEPLLASDPSDATNANARVEDVQCLRRADGSVELRIRLDEADAHRAMEQLGWLASHDDAVDPSIPINARRAIAFANALNVAMDRAPADSSGEDRDRLVVEARAVPARPEVNAAASAEAPGGSGRTRRLVPRLHGRRPAMSVWTLERLACTAVTTHVATDECGTPLDVGRRRRAPTAGQRRQLLHRDGGCRFPGCETKVGLHAHHAIEWQDGGMTDLDNLVLVCHFHHRFVHNADWRVVPAGSGRFRFLDAAGDEVTSGASAEAVEWAARCQPTKRSSSLAPPWYLDEPIDWELCLLVLHQAFEERALTTA